MTSIKFISNDGGEIECDEKTLRSLKSDMIDKMLDSGMQVTQECELDFSLKVITAVIYRGKASIKGEVLGEMIVLTDYLQMASECAEYCRMFNRHSRLTLWTPRIAEIAAIHKQYMPLQHASQAELVDLVFRGFRRDLIVDLSNYNVNISCLPELVCDDPRCTPEFFHEWFDRTIEAYNFYGYVKRGLLDPTCALKLVTPSIASFTSSDRFEKHEDSPLKFDLLKRIWYVSEVERHKNCSHFVFWNVETRQWTDKIDKERVKNDVLRISPGLELYAVY